jgi:hypothetical protein
VIGFLILFGSVYLLALGTDVVLRALHRPRAPELRADGLTWRVQHAPPSMLWLLPAGLVLGIVVFGTRGRLLFALPLILWAVFYAFGRSELRATPEGLAWRRRWPMRGGTWAWRELRRVRCTSQGLLLMLGTGEEVPIQILGAKLGVLREVCAALEATRAAPPPEAEPVPEVPQALRQLQHQQAAQRNTT